MARQAQQMEMVADYAADVPRVRQVPFDAPWNWLGAGWRDTWRQPVLSLGYGLVFAVAAFLIVFGLYLSGLEVFVLPLAGGFLLIGPMVSVGLYEASRRYLAGEPVVASNIAFVGVRSPGQLAFMGVVLLIIYFAWVEIALLLFMLFVGPGDLPSPEELVPTLLFTVNGLALLVIGTAVGAALAFFVFAITAISVPMLMARKIDVVTAALTSVQAIYTNPKAMLLWAVLIVALVAFGCATLFVGLIVVLPLIGHATWHAYVETVGGEPQRPEDGPSSASGSSGGSSSSSAR